MIAVDTSIFQNLSGGLVPPTITQDVSYEKSRLGNEAGALVFCNKVRKDEFGSFIPEDTSFIQLQDKNKSFISFRGGKIISKTTSDKSDYITANYYKFVGNDAQYYYYGDKYETIRGSHHYISGTHDKKTVEAAQKLQKITSQIDNKCVEEIEKNAKNDEKIVCPVCGTNKVDIDRASTMVNTAFKYINALFNIKPNSSFGSLMEKAQAVLRTVLGFFLDDIIIAALTGGSCGCSGCKNGSISSPLYAIQQGNKAAADEYEKNKKQIEKLQKQIPAESHIKTYSSDYITKIGLVRNESKVISFGEKNPIITGLVKGKPDWCLIPSSAGACKRAIYSPPTLLAGSKTWDIGQRYNVTVGSGGYTIETSGKAALVGATTLVNATEGELVMASKNKTIISGANVVIEARQADGDAICLESDRVWVGGKLSVKADLAVKGSIVMDGGIQCNHLITPIENTQTTLSSSPHNVHSGSNWNNPIKPDATTMDVFDKIWKNIERIPVVSLLLAILRPDFIKTITEETYSTAQISQVVDNTFLPTGYAMIYDYTTYMPITVYGFGTCSYGGISSLNGTAFVTPSMIPIYTYTHNHGSPGDQHSHSYIMPRMLGYDSAAAATASRDEPSVIPTPARATGMGNQTGNYPSLGDLGPCGGGGSPFGNASRIRAARIKRNQSYGINSDNAFGDKDYVDAPVKFTPDGELIPEPTFNLFECE